MFKSFAKPFNLENWIYVVKNIVSYSIIMRFRKSENCIQSLSVNDNLANFNEFKKSDKNRLMKFMKTER
ncbi:hypothetical protein BpHYR1_015120 [Brachionus plicatilis]|uniref:Uncharacterized protein n=1 Tax=Brachionus plicatilis TaxID=10195 RepID=A0A3M7S9Q9_BRAPC|nr:hypothetical protein BpHYR1_015120 [Brachionus plicatilis]